LILDASTAILRIFLHSATFEQIIPILAIIKGMKTIKRELAHIGMFGPDEIVITKAYLADCAETFDGKCPVSLGHKLADWMPKFGNVKSVELLENDESLSGDVEMHDELADAVMSPGYAGTNRCNSWLSNPPPCPPGMWG